MVKDNQMFTVQKPIQLQSGNSIRVGTTVQITHGNIYMDGGLLPKDYQDDFAHLIEHEMQTGWKYLRPETFNTSKYHD